jgi:hypothetical protein
MRCFLFALACATLRAQVSPVQKVIQLLDELKGKVQAELANEESLMQDYTKYCDSEANAREDAITAGKRTSTDLQATIQDSTAATQGLTAEIDDLAAKIRTGDADLQAATKVREQERESFEAREKELSETVDTVERAVIVLKRGQTFLQSKNGAKELQMLADSLNVIVQATWVDSHERQAVQQLLQSGDSDEDLSLQPQASVAAYKSKGGGIIETLQDMQTKAEAALSDARKAEMESKHAYAMLKQGLDQSGATMSKRKGEASSERSRHEEQASSASGDLEETKQGLSADTKYLNELRSSCEEKSKEWDARQTEAASEMQAIAKAKEILEGGVKVFLQQASGDADARNHATTLLRALQKEHPSFMLAQLVSAAQSDPFGKVRELIESMVARLMEEAGQEADAKAFCDTETAKSKAKQEELTAAVDQHAVRIEKSTAAKAKLAEQVRQLQEEVAEIDQADASGTALRQKEHEEYVTSSTENKQSAEAVANAMQVLQEYYSQGSFLQTGAKQAPEFGGAKTDIASTILEMLEVAEADFTRLLAEAEAAETSAANAYKRLSQDNKVTRAAKIQERKGKEAEAKSLSMNLLNYKDDHASSSKELDAVLAYQDKLKPQCETKVMTYEERVQKREEEIAGLKEALEILSA